jgi:hypothetical protein
MHCARLLLQEDKDGVARVRSARRLQSLANAGARDINRDASGASRQLRGITKESHIVATEFPEQRTFIRMRKYHRWISTVCMFFLAWVSLTGGLLTLDELNPPPGLGGPPRSAVVPSVDSASFLANTALRLRLHNLLKELHTGSIIGLSGQWLDLLTGLAFVVLAVTGIAMYFNLLAQRRKLGRRGPFWN